MAKNELETIVRLYDPAFAEAGLDWKTQVLRYAESRDPADLPALPPGISAVTFHFRRLKGSQVRWVELGDSVQEQYCRAFLCGVEKISGGRFGPDGWVPARGERTLAMNEDDLEDQKITRLDQQEVGQWIYRRSIVPFDCSVLSLLLPTSLAAYDGNAHRYAGRTRRAAPSSSEPPKDG